MLKAPQNEGDDERVTNCNRCNGTGWLRNWVAIVGLFALGFLILYGFINWNDHLPRFRGGQTRAFILGSMGLSFYGAFHYRWCRCRCNP